MGLGDTIRTLAQMPTLLKLKKGMVPRAPDVTDSCLLYTSPSPRDMRRARMPSSA